MKQNRIIDHLTDKGVESGKVELPHLDAKKRTPKYTLDIDVADFKGHPLWDILVETARRSPFYPGLSGYVRSEIIPKEPDISAKELASRLSISVGEALVLLDDMKGK